MRVHELKASELRKLPEYCTEFYNGNIVEHVLVKHRNLDYRVGFWNDWMGEFYVVEVRTGMIFRGPLLYVKDMINLCSACVYEPDEVRYK